MDIKLIKNFEAGSYSPLNRALLLQMIDDTRQLDRFQAKRIFMFSPATNERYEILPEIPKFNLADIQYGEKEHDYFVFTSARMINAQELAVDYYWYNTADGEPEVLFTGKISLEQLKQQVFLKVFVFDGMYCLFETVYGSAEDETQHFELLLYDVKNKKSMDVYNPLLTEKGIDRIIALDGNQCAIKISNEMIGIVNVNQFVSDLVLGLENVYIDILDQSDGQTVLPILIRCGGSLIYKKKDLASGSEDVILYDVENKIKKVRLNSSGGLEDLSRIYLIDNVPYICRESEKGTRFINLNTQKTEIKLRNDVKVRYVSDNVIVTQRHVRKMFFMQAENDYIEVFRFPDMHHAIFKTRGRLEDCLAHFDELLIFTNSKGNKA